MKGGGNPPQVEHARSYYDKVMALIAAEHRAHNDSHDKPNNNHKEIKPMK